jgi:hypothetical protein
MRKDRVNLCFIKRENLRCLKFESIKYNLGLLQHFVFVLSRYYKEFYTENEVIQRLIQGTKEREEKGSFGSG